LRPNSRTWIRGSASLFSGPNKYLASFTPGEEDAGYCLRVTCWSQSTIERNSRASIQCPFWWSFLSQNGRRPKLCAGSTTNTRSQSRSSPRGRRSPSGADPPSRRIILVIADPAVGSGPYSSAGQGQPSIWPDSTSRHALVKAHRSARWLSLVKMLGSLRLIPRHLQMFRNDQD
jgi:hypothetical protein